MLRAVTRRPSTSHFAAVPNTSKCSLHIYVASEFLLGIPLVFMCVAAGTGQSNARAPQTTADTGQCSIGCQVPVRAPPSSTGAANKTNCYCCAMLPDLHPRYNEPSRTLAVSKHFATTPARGTKHLPRNTKIGKAASCEGETPDLCPRGA